MQKAIKDIQDFFSDARWTKQARVNKTTKDARRQGVENCQAYCEYLIEKYNSTFPKEGGWVCWNK